MATSQLAQLPEVERLSPACIRILGGNPGKFTLQGTNTYLLGTGRSRLLVDTGEGRPSWAVALRRVLLDEDATVSEVVLTHWHHDHVSGVPDLLGDPRTAGARIYKSRRRWGDAARDAVRDALESTTQQQTQQTQQEQLDIVDGHVFRAEGATLTAVHTPGHTADHVALLLAEEDACLTGDCVLGQGTAVFEDLAAYVDSLRRLQPQFGGRVYPGHGPVVEKGPDRIAEYIAHRQQREDQVLETLRGTTAAGSGGGAVAAGMTAMELVKIIYSDVREDLHPAAERGVLQILAKLQGEDKVAMQGEAWTLKTRSTL
ncbi:lactamase [Magnaporthiopsis poae ATCC 64411]|uniref:Lactamase n=1 Tax=Magnaporthiopsis poae (strain ATCC 64411 / 73-15) TaxID=644358 RepID=A0A0C4EFG4_MAGP6|nr:lactamase [Magnaporthiopsis poae ATCC 64411]